MRARRCDPGKIIVVHNGVSVPAQPCSPCSHQDVLFLGRLDARKSPDVLLRASRDVLKRFPETKVIFGGDGEIEKNEALAKELGIADRCEFHGWVSGDDREALFERAAVYCLPSKHEGLPMSVLEAMAHGIPTVATAVGGVPQVIEEGVSGFLVDVNDEAALSERLTALLGAPELREELGSNGRDQIMRKFGLDRTIVQIVDIYGALLRVRGSDDE